jgi:YkoY family integral membrane protein
MEPGRTGPVRLVPEFLGQPAGGDVEMGSFQLGDVPLIAWYIGVLVFLEGLLSADNALVLAVMVRHLEKKQQRRVLFYGIWGAVIFRIIALSLYWILLNLWYCKVIGGLYLLYLAASHFLWHRAEEEPSVASDASAVPVPRRMLGGFWGTVASITMADIAFSIDSILAAVATAESFPDRFGPNGKLVIVFIGGVLGIITMRFVVRYFLILLDRFPGLSDGAYYLVAWIGLKLTISGFHDGKYLSFHIPELIFWSGMIGIALASLLFKPKQTAQQAAAMSESLDLLESEEDPSSAEGQGP